MKKRISLLLVFMLLVSMFAACSSEPATEEPAEEPVATEEAAGDDVAEEPSDELAEATLEFVFAGGDPQGKALLEERVEAFNAANPNVTIIAMPSGSGAYDDFIKTKDAVGEFPDMIEMRDVETWEDRLAPLPEEALAMIANQEGIQFNGVNYVAPLSEQMTSMGCYYNVALFEELGLEEPTTYDEFLALCQTIQDSGTAPIVIGGKDGWHMGFWWGNYWIKNVYSQDSNWIAAKYNGEVSFTDENVQLTFDQYADLFQYVEKGWLSTADNQIVSFLMAEKAAMFFSGSWMVQQVADADPSFQLGWFPVPDVDGELRLYGGSTVQGFALSKEAAEDEAKVAAFNAFLEYFYSDEVYAPYLATVTMAASTANPPVVDYPSDLVQEFADAKAQAAFIDLNWNNKLGENLLPGAFRNYAYKAFQEMVVNGTSAQELGEQLDAQWEIEAALKE